MTKKTPHPTEYYLASRLYEGDVFPAGGVWGSLGDGPVIGLSDMTDAVTESFGDVTPALDAIKVWHFTDDCPPRDVTEDIIGEIASANAEREEAWEQEYTPKYDDRYAAE